MPGEGEPRVYSKVRDVVAEARAVRSAAAIRVGLAGLSTTPAAAIATMFLPCPNLATAARQIAQLRTRCEASERSEIDPIFCALAAYRGSWEQPDTRFASAVRASVARGDAADFDMPKDTGLKFPDVVLDLQSLAFAAPPSRPSIVADDRERGWKSGLFPVAQAPSEASSDRPSIDDSAAESMQRDGRPSAGLGATDPPTDDLFVRRSSRPER